MVTEDSRHMSTCVAKAEVHQPVCAGMLQIPTKNGGKPFMESKQNPLHHAHAAAPQPLEQHALALSRGRWQR